MDNLEKGQLQNDNFSRSTLEDVFQFFYALYTSLILIAGIAWGFFILMRGFGLDYRVSSNFINFLFFVFALMIPGSFSWLLLSAMLHFIDRLEENYHIVKIGLIGVFLNFFLIYLTVYSDSFRWILD